MGLKFRRQHAVGRYVADFACLEARLLIEIEGYWHQFCKAADALRERALRAAGYDVVRYDVENDAVSAHILAEMIAYEARIRINGVVDVPSPPAPLPQAGEGG